MTELDEKALDVYLIALESLAERLHRAGQHVWGREVDDAVRGIKEATGG